MCVHEQDKSAEKPKQTKESRGEALKAIRCDLKNQMDGIEIIPLADLHIGDQCADLKAIQAKIDYIRDKPNAFCVLNGDLMDTAIASSIGDTYAASLQPMEQLKHCIKIFEPISDKILCITSGNHENRVYKSDGIDLTEIMAAQLGIADKYTDTAAILYVRFGYSSRNRKPVLYTIYVTHGSGGGRKEGGKVNRLADLACIVDADIYIHSHVHLPIVFKNSFYRADPNNNVVKQVDKLFVSTAAYLGYGGYGSRQGYKPNSIDTPVISLSSKHKRMSATL